MIIPNELLWVILLVVTFSFSVLSYKFFGKNGLFVWMAIAIIIANIQVMKTIQIFGLMTALGNIVYGTTFLTTDILCENHGKKEARKAVWIGFFMLIAVTALTQLLLFFIPHESGFAMHNALVDVFGILPRIAIASLTAYLISQNFDVWFYNMMKKKTKHIWIRNNLSTMTSQFFDNIIFTLIAFLGVFSFSIMIQIFITSYVMKWVVAVCDTPFIYLAKRIKKKGSFVFKE